MLKLFVANKIVVEV